MDGREMTRRGDDKGAATTILVVGMGLVLAATTMLLTRIAHANDLRTRAQTAADAAALAGAADIRDRGAAEIVNGLLPQGIIYQGSAADAARRYAAQNDATVDDVHASGFFGYTVKVDVHTNQCQTKVDPNTPLDRIPCQNKDEPAGQHGTATEIAQVTFPVCVIRGLDDGQDHGPTFDPPSLGVFCNGQRVFDFVTARRLFTVRLVDKEDPTAFDPAIFTFPAGGGGASDTANERLGQQLAAKIGWTGEEWNCLDRLWIGESGWNELAKNQSSGAYGIPQSLPPEKMAVYGSDYLTNPVTQIRWGMDYIARRYGTPCNAYGQWLSRNPHWY
jgi:hypothetical protein